METVVIDTFDVPHESRDAFLALAGEVQVYLKSLPGFVEGYLYEERGEEESRRRIVTIAVWNDEKALRNASQAVAAWNQQMGVDRQARAKQLGVEVKRGVYNRSPF